MSISAIDAIDAIDVNSFTDSSSSVIAARDSISCNVSESEKEHLFHQAGIIGRWIRENLVFPLSNVENSFKKEFLERESWISTELFWDTPFLDLRYPKQKEIREQFNRYDQFVVIESQGKQIKLKCRVIESKGCPKEGALNHLIVQGNISTLDNNMPGLYPFLDTYLKEKEENPNIPPARFVIFNHYDNKICDIETNAENNYYPGDLDEWSFVFKKTLESLVDEYGQLHLLAAHSLGNIPVVEHLKHVKDEEFARLFPKTLFLAQGPSSFKEVTKNIPFSFEIYPWGWFSVVGFLVYILSKWTGWAPDIDKTLVERLNSLPKNEEMLKKLKDSRIVITEVYHDYYFPGESSLCSSKILEKLTQLVNLYRMTFNPPLSWGIPRAQHNYNIGLLQRQDLVREKLHWVGESAIDLKDPKEIIDIESKHQFMIHHGESLVDAVMRSAWSEHPYKSAPDLTGRVIAIAPAA